MTEFRTYTTSEVAAFFRVRERFGPLSNMASGFPIRVCGVDAPSSEALYQALRFPHLPEFQREILDQTSPILAKRHTYTRVRETRADWEGVRVNAMRYVLRAKVGSTQGALLDLLRGTGSAPIVEVSHRDDFWGARPEGGTLVGRNVLGRLLMELRRDIQDHQNGSPLTLIPRFPVPVVCGRTLQEEQICPDPLLAPLI
jgi:ribA/ribD-fused uncharacterized protein